MATTPVSQSILAPKKRAEALAISTYTLSKGTTLLASIVGYNLLIAVLLIALYPVMTQYNIEALLSSYLANNLMSGMLGTHITHISGFAAFLGIYFYSAFNGILFGGILAYIGGAALPLNIENGMLDLALSRPISRTRYYLETWFGILLSCLIAALFTIAFAWLTTLFVSNPGVDWTWLWITQWVQFCLFFLAASIGMLVGSLVNASRAAAGAAVGILALGYLFNTFGAISDKLSWLLKLSPFYYAPSIDPLVLHQLTWWYPWVLVIAGLVCGIAGLLIFNRRDFPTV